MENKKRTRKGPNYTVDFLARMTRVMDRFGDDKIGVKLGRLCIEHGYKVTEVAEVLGVTKAMVYLWFYGTFEPSKEKAVAVKKLIKRIEQMSNRGSTTPCQQESSS